MAAVLSVLACALLGGCSGDRPDRHETGHVEALGTLPYESLQDWVSYSDAVVVGRVVGEREVPATAAELEVGEGMIGRDVTVRVERTLWARGGTAPVPPKEVTFGTWGWTFDGDERRRVSSGADWLEVEHAYLIPLTHTPTWGWAPIDPAATATIDGGEARALPAAEGPASIASLEGETTDEIQATLEATDPYPAAVANAELDPEARFAAVAADEHGP